MAKNGTAAKDLKEFIEYLQGQFATKLSYGHAGVGSISHVSGTLFNAQFGLKPGARGLPRHRRPPSMTSSAARSTTWSTSR